MLLEDMLHHLENEYRVRFTVEDKDGNKTPEPMLYEGATYNGSSTGYAVDHMFYREDEDGNVPEEITEDNMFDVRESDISTITIHFP